MSKVLKKRRRNNSEFISPFLKRVEVSCSICKYKYTQGIIKEEESHNIFHKFFIEGMKISSLPHSKPIYCIKESLSIYILDKQDQKLISKIFKFVEEVHKYNESLMPLAPLKTLKTMVVIAIKSTPIIQSIVLFHGDQTIGEYRTHYTITTTTTTTEEEETNIEIKKFKTLSEAVEYGHDIPFISIHNIWIADKYKLNAPDIYRDVGMALMTWGGTGQYPAPNSSIHFCTPVDPMSSIQYINICPHLNTLTGCNESEDE